MYISEWMAGMAVYPKEVTGKVGYSNF